MNFSEEWNHAYEINTNLSIWPWSDLVRYVKRFTKLDENSKVLELGCGAGANIPFFLSLGSQYYAIDGSDIAITELNKKFPELRDRLIVGDFTEKLPFSESFDLIIDRSSLTHNSTTTISNCIDMIERKLTNDGMFIGIDWFSTKHSEYDNGEKIEDEFTRFNFQTGQFRNIGIVHFSDKQHLQNLFKKFSFLILEHKIIKKEIPPENQIFASWDLVVKKIG